MKTMLMTAALSMMLLGQVSFAEEAAPAAAAKPAVTSEQKAELKGDRDQVNTACVEDAKTAGCEGETVGKGLLKCLHSYKKSHKSYKFSDSCKTAMRELHKDRKAMKK